MSAIGFIGVGNMGAAMARGLKGLEVWGTDLNHEYLKTLADEIGLNPSSSVQELAENCDYIVLAVKPQHAQGTLTALGPALTKDHCLISIAAGLPQKKLAAMIGQICPVVRVMPNTPAMVGEGVFALCLDDDTLNEAQKTYVSDALKQLGQVHVLAEKDFDAFTAVVGSGPAYVFYFMEACVEAAVALGLPRPQATQMVKGLFTGSAKLADESDKHLSVLREMVTSPAGTTVQALQHMDRTATRGNIMDAIRESYERSVELGE